MSFGFGNASDMDMIEDMRRQQYIHLEDSPQTDEEKTGPLRLYVLTRASADDGDTTSVHFRATSKRQVCRYLVANPDVGQSVISRDELGYEVDDPDGDGEEEEIMYNAAQLEKIIEMSSASGGPLYHAFSLKEVKDGDIVVCNV